jgi:hypothetical protein
MSTISSTINNTYLMYKMAQDNGQSLFSTESTKTKKAGQATDSMWDAYSSSSSAAASTLNSINSINSNRNELVSSYDTAAKTFKAELGSALKDLSGSIKEMKKLDFHVGSDAITTKTTTAEDGKTTTSNVYSKELKDVLSTVKDFVKDYNTSVSLFNDYSDVSKKMSQMSSMFSDATARADTYKQIGLNVQSDGTIEIDEDKLAKAITESPDRVGGILGKDGLVGKAEAHVQFASGQSDKLFPSINSMFGGQLERASVYTGGSMLKLSSYASMGNLVNMMF